MKTKPVPDAAPGGEASKAGPGGKGVYWGIAAFVLFPLLTLALYHGVLHGPMIFDDLAQIKNNFPLQQQNLDLKNILEGLKESRLAGRFAANFTLMINYRFGLLDPYGYHLVNLGIHAVTGILVFFLLRITLLLSGKGENFQEDRANLIAFLAALLWLVHPLGTQTTSYIVQRMNGLSTLFFAAALLSYIRGRMQDRRRYFLLCGLFFALSLGSKEIGLVLPVIIVIYEWYFFQDLDFAWLKRGLPWLGGAVLLGALAGFIYFDFHPVQGVMNYYGIRDFTPMERILTQFRVVLMYLTLIILPFPGRMNLEHDFPLSHSLFDPMSTFLSLLIILALLGAAAALAKKHRIVSFAILWYFATLALESSFIPIELVFEHRTYLPSVMVILALTLLLFQAMASPRSAVAACVCAALLLSIGTVYRNRVWADNLVLMADCLKKSPNKTRVLQNYAAELSDDKVGRYGEAVVYYQRALKQDPDNVKCNIFLGALMARLGMLHQGAKHIQHGLALEPDNYKGLYQMGMLLMRANKPEEALAYFNKSVALEPRYAPAVHNQGLAYQVLGDQQKALQCIKRSIELAPADPRGHHNYAMLLKKMGNYEGAKRHLWLALEFAQKQGMDNNVSQARAELKALEGRT